jgi:hypothetical protein
MECPDKVSSMQQLLGAWSNVRSDRDSSSTTHHVEQDGLPLRFRVLIKKLDADSPLASALFFCSRDTKRAVFARAFNSMSQAALEAWR